MKINSLPRNPARACVLTLRLSALGVSNERGGNLFLACRLILCETDNPPGWTGQSATLTHCQWKENKSHFSGIQRQRRKELRGNALDIWIRFDKSTLAVNIPVPSPKQIFIFYFFPPRIQSLRFNLNVRRRGKKFFFFF